MNDRVPSQSINKITWGDFLGLTRDLGVRIQKTKEPFVGRDGISIDGAYLCRRVGDEILIVALPRDYSPDMKIGPWRFESVCRRLQVPTRYPGWPIIM